MPENDNDSHDDTHRLKEVPFFPNAADYLECKALDYNIASLWRKLVSVKGILKAKEIAYSYPDYEQTIKLEEVASDISRIVEADPDDPDYPNEYRYNILTCMAARGLFARTSDRYYGIRTDSDSLPGPVRYSAIGLSDLASGYVERIVSRREPLEENDNDSKALTDIISVYHAMDDTLKEHILKNPDRAGFRERHTLHPVSQNMTTELEDMGKEKIECKPETSPGTDHADPDHLRTLGDWYRARSPLEKNIMSGIFGFTSTTALCLGTMNGLHTMNQNDMLYTAGIGMSETNMFYPLIIKGIGIKDTLIHSPGLFAGIYAGLYLCDKIIR